MTVYDIVKMHLHDNGYTALTDGWECACMLDDFMPCGGNSCLSCEPAYHHDCQKCEQRTTCAIRPSYSDEPDSIVTESKECEYKTIGA